MKLLFDREEQFDRLLLTLNTLEPGSDEYQKVLDQINTFVHIDERLHPQEPSRLDKILANPALLGLFGNLTLGVLILNYEKLDIITSRAFNLIRPK